MKLTRKVKKLQDDGFDEEINLNMLPNKNPVFKKNVSYYLDSHEI